MSTQTYSGGTVSTAQTAITAYITGGGITTLQATNTFGNVEIDNGTVAVASAANLGNASSPTVTFNASSGDTATLDITATMDAGKLMLETNGTVQVDGVTATLSSAPTGSGVLSVTGTSVGILAVNSDLHTSAVLITISANGILQVGSTTNRSHVSCQWWRFRTSRPRIA